MERDDGAGGRAGPEPRAAIRLRDTARTYGWETRVDVCSGMWKDRAVASVLVRFARGETHAVAQYLDGKAATAYAWTVPPGERVKPVLPRRIPFRALAAMLRS